MTRTVSSETLLSVALPGPWWTNLTYRSARACAPGVRVRVPVGRGTRVALVLGPPSPGDDAYAGELRAVAEVVDERPILPVFSLPLLEWFCATYLCGMGTAMKTLLPTAFLSGQSLDLGKKERPSAPPPVSFPAENRFDAPAGPPETVFLYEPADERRFACYLEILSDGSPTLFACPVYETAQAFYDYLARSPDFPDPLKKRLLLLPRSGAKAEWRAWSRLLLQHDAVIAIGGQSAATVPLPGIVRIVVEDESNNIWRTLRAPSYNVRSLLAKRAVLEGAQLVLGGRMPSARAYLRLPRETTRAARDAARGKRAHAHFVDLKLAYAPAVKGVQDTLAVSDALLRETNAAVADGSWAFWILDRKGYAGEVLCEECARSLRCGRCGGALRWEASAARLRCGACGGSESVPETCPNCGGRLLSARRPGLEALLPLARSALHVPGPVLSAEAGPEALPAASLQGPGGLLVGTRAILSLCDRLRVGLVGWIDADGEAYSQDYDARVRAFGLLWESWWRGPHAEERVLLVQSRRPGKDWQRGLLDGWPGFWHRELEERRAFGMPPFAPLVRVDCAAWQRARLAPLLEQGGFEHWFADVEDGKRDTAWIRTTQLTALRNLLGPFFHIGQVRRGFPSLTIRHE